MMNLSGYLTLKTGEKMALPAVISYQLFYTDGSTCDSFEVTSISDGAQDFDQLTSAKFFTAFWDEKQVFYGIVDEVEYEDRSAGKTITFFGRNLAGILMDNHAQELAYSAAGWRDIAARHVTPYGLPIRLEKTPPAAVDFSVSAGSSEWTAVYEFCTIRGGLSIRVDETGALVVGGGETGRVLSIGPAAPVTSFTRRVRRYGMVSEVAVYETGSPAPTTIGNPAAQALGIEARRRITLPRGSGAAAHARAAKREIDQSMTRARTAALTLPIPFAARVGDRVEGARLVGSWLVTAVTVTPAETTLELRRS